MPVTGLALPDGVRDVDEAFVRDIDALVDELLAEHGLACDRLDADDRDGWVKRACEAVSGPAGDRQRPSLRARASAPAF